MFPFSLLVALFCFYVAFRSAVRHDMIPAVLLFVVGGVLLAQSLMNPIHGV